MIAYKKSSARRGRSCDGRLRPLR